MNRTAEVIYHQESEGWWAESPGFPSFFAAGATLDETKQRVREVLPKLAGGDYSSLMHITHRADVPPQTVAIGSFEGANTAGCAKELAAH